MGTENIFRKPLLSFFFFFMFFFSAFSQIKDVIGKMESPEKTKHSSIQPDFSTEKLALFITKDAITDTEKVLNIYGWITKNISYDNELMRSEALQRQIYISEENIIQQALDRKMALCGGFALLFKSLCADVGIMAEVVDGFTKDYSGRFRGRKTPHHTWNAVKLNGEWQLLDITWAISHGSGNKPDNFWFLTRPQDFIYSHYPENEIWTLLRNPISLSEFKKSIHR